MPNRYYKPRQTATAQVSTGEITSVDATPANNDFTVTIGAQAVSVTGDTDVATTATNLRTALNATTQPYFSVITWSGTGGDIIGTADAAGSPFFATLSVTGAGSGAIANFVATVASASPHDAADTANWSDETLPTSGDDIIIGHGSVSILYGLEAITIADSLTTLSGFTGAIGLEQYAFATSADGATLDESAPEYRSHYFRCDLQDIVIGREDGLGQFPATVAGGISAPIGSTRIKIHNDRAGASRLRVENTASNTPTNKPAVRYLADNLAADVEVAKAPGGVGVAVDEPGETATIGDVKVTDRNDTSRLILGEGVTFSGDWEQQGGSNVLNAAADISGAVESYGGSLDIVGRDYSISSLSIFDGATVRDSHVDTGGVDWTTISVLNGGTLILTDTSEARTCTTINLNRGGTVEVDWSVFTATNLLFEGIFMRVAMTSPT